MSPLTVLFAKHMFRNSAFLALNPDGEAAEYLTVVTYPYPDARKALEQQAASGDLLSRRLPQGGFVISQPDQPTNAYLAYAGEDYQVEIYDPRPGRALELAVDGSITPAG